LFAESQSRIIVSLEEKHLDALKAVCSEAGAPLSVIGKTGGSTLRIDSIVELDLDKAHAVFTGSLERFITSS